MRGDIHVLKAPRGTRGHEQAGRRFAVVVHADEFAAQSTWLVAPTSTSARPASFRPEITIGATVTRVLAEQTTAVDHRRLGDVVGHLTFDEARAVDAALRAVLDLRS